jgi:hypothetical protein
MSVTPTAIGYHIILRLLDNRVIATDEASRRTLARVVLRIAQPLGLIAFRLVDTHLHLEVLCDRDQAGELARQLESALWQRLKLPVTFDRPRIKPIAGQRHLSSLFFYIYRQDEHHGYDDDPFWEASNLPDLLGLRVLGAESAARVCRVLPRVRRDELRPLLGNLPAEPPAELPLAVLPEAAAAAFGLSDLRGRSAEVVDARRAAAHAARSRAPLRDVANALSWSIRSIKRARSIEVAEHAVRAVWRQWVWRTVVRPADARLTGVETEL